MLKLRALVATGIHTLPHDTNKHLKSPHHHKTFVIVKYICMSTTDLTKITSIVTELCDLRMCRRKKGGKGREGEMEKEGGTAEGCVEIMVGTERGRMEVKFLTYPHLGALTYYSHKQS